MMRLASVLTLMRRIRRPAVAFCSTLKNESLLLSRMFWRSEQTVFQGRSFSGPRFHRGPRLHFPGHSHRHYRRHRHRHIYVLPPAVYYGSTYYSDCGWLRHRALRTGSPYWWERYYACIDEY